MVNLVNTLGFWRDCIRSEGAFDQSFGLTKDFELTSRTKAILFDGLVDPFIFANYGGEVPIDRESLRSLSTRVQQRGEWIYFGYPLITFQDEKTAKARVAPLFIIQLDVNDNNLIAAEPYATLGSCAGQQLGLKDEEISALNHELAAILQDKSPTKVQDIVAVLDREAKINFIEDIDPTGIMRHQKPSSITQDNGCYNRAVLFTAEASVYNLHLLNDLDQLVQKNEHELESTSLSYLKNNEALENDTSFVPIMPFTYDPYQLEAMQHVVASRYSVITGPPGTGKSQFIANLVTNLFLQRKKVLFVSHTGEAVRVVNQRIGEHFEHMIMQTGRKEIRQALGDTLDTMVREHSVKTSDEHSVSMVRNVDIEHTWSLLKKHTQFIQKSDEFNGLLLHTLSDLDYYMQQTGFIAWIKRYLLKRQVNKLNEVIKSRTPSYEIRKEVLALKKQHTQQSREYVKARYLSLMLDNGNYGKVASYVQSIRQRRSLSRFKTHNPGEQYMHAALSSINVWSCTLKSVGASFPLVANLFDYVIFDEASQIDLPSAAPALYRAKNVIVVGDGNQLTHITKINEQVEAQLAEQYEIGDLPVVSYRSTSLFSSAKYRLQQTERTLLGHYRSNADIANLFNKVFYGGDLRIYTNERESLPYPLKEGAFYINVEGIATKHSSGSRENIDEVKKLVELFDKILPMAINSGLTIGITSPYSRQVKSIARALESRYSQEQLSGVKILTVHKFQGGEVDILLFSTVVASHGNAGSVAWYRNNFQILNVAISRPKRILLIIGDKSHAEKTDSSLGIIARTLDEKIDIPVTSGQAQNEFERLLAVTLKHNLPASYRIVPQYLLDGRYTLDIAVIFGDKKVAVELDGSQHHIIGELVVFDDTNRDTYLKKHGWIVIRATIPHLIKNPEAIAESVEQAMAK